MKLSFPLFFVLSSVMGTAMIAVEPCAGALDYDTTKYGEYDMVACNACAEHGKGKGQCCDSLYRHSLGRNDDDVINDNGPYESCFGIGGKCTPGDADCMPGLTCVGNNVRNYYTGTLKGTCQLNTDDPNAHAASSLVTSSLTGNTTKSGHSFVLVVVGLLGAAMIAMKVGHHRGLVRRHQYNEVDATTRMDV